jgi:putative nucleotidyltransferase with HDIG domain
MPGHDTATPDRVNQVRVRHLIARLPAFSPVALRLMGIVFRDDVSFGEVSKLAQLDPVLSGEILKIANSGLYGRRSSVRTIVQALAVIGMSRLTTIVVTAAIWKGLPRRPPQFVREWWRHSIATALAAEHMNVDSANANQAYTAGLLHAIGQLALFQYDGESYEEMVDEARSAGGDLRERERATFGVDHTELAEAILSSWHLPPEICLAAAEHHSAVVSSPLSAAVHTGCFGAEYMGFGECGSHSRGEADGMPKKVAELMESNYLPQVLPLEVNRVECSLI